MDMIKPEAFKACYMQFQRADKDRDVMITQLINSYEDLQLQYDRAIDQLESEKENRMIWQMQARESRKELTQVKLANVRLQHLFSPLPPTDLQRSSTYKSLTCCRSPVHLSL